MQNDIASQLIDENGQLKKFDRWVEDIKGMTNHYVGPWLRTEYNTAVIRAHQAADWKHFEAESDVFPNVRWMPTTSPQQDPLHRQYWEKKLTLPINHPFWEKHRPGDRWNCKCTLQQTEEPVNDEVIRDFYPVPQQQGLDNNPADDGKLFSDSHPYIAKAYAGANKAVSRAVGTVVDFVPAKTIEEAEKFAEQYIQKANFGDFKGGVSYKGISLEIANEINRTLQHIFSTVDIPKISGIKPISGSSKTGQKVFSSSDSIAAYSPAFGGIYLNTDVLKSTKAFAEYMKRSRDAWDKVMSNLDKLSPAQREIAERYKRSGRSLVDDSIRGCIIHEFGHHIQWKKMPVNLVNSLTKIAEHSVKISGYAGTNKGEYIAESFASWMKGEKKIEKSLQDFFDSMAKEAPTQKRASQMRVREDKVLRSTTREMIDLVLDNVHNRKPINSTADLGQIDKPVIAFLKKQGIQPSTDRLIVSDVGMQHALRASKAAKGIGMPEAELVEALANLDKCEVYFDDDKKNVWYVWHTPQQSYKLVFDFDEKFKVDRVKFKVNQLTTAGKVNASDLGMQNLTKIR